MTERLRPKFLMMQQVALGQSFDLNIGGAIQSDAMALQRGVAFERARSAASQASI
jgi:hypothetical protein